MKGNACQRVGMESLRVFLPKNINTEELLDKIRELNDNPNVHGIQIGRASCRERV